MRLLSAACLAFVSASLLTVSCKKEDSTSQTDVSNETLKKIETLGFSTENVRKVSNGYLVEGDIVLTDENLNSNAVSPTVVIAEVEQYRTTNLVKSLPRTITISVSGTLVGNSVWSTAADQMIARYNAIKSLTGVNFNLTFQRASPGVKGNVDIVGFDQGPSGGFITLGSSGFPNAAGDPYNQIKMNTNPQAYGTNPNVNYITSVLQHEMGHCIGFRHTDYFDRSLSCGGRKSNEEKPSSGLGAIWIQGTPTGFDSESFMLACSAGTDRTFNANDIIALNALY